MPKLRVTRRSVLWIVTAVLVITLGIAAWIRLTAQDSILQTMNIAPYAAKHIDPIDAPAWSPSGPADQYGFLTVLEQERRSASSSGDDADRARR